MIWRSLKTFADLYFKCNINFNKKDHAWIMLVLYYKIAKILITSAANSSYYRFSICVSTWVKFEIIAEKFFIVIH